MRDIAHRVAYLKGSPIRRVTSLLEAAKEKKGIISFAGGAPSLPPPIELQEEAKRVANDIDSYKYGSTQGNLQLREAISNDLKSKSLDYSPSQICITSGCTEAIILGMLALLDPGDEIVIFDPAYIGYPEPLKMFGARLRWVTSNVDRGFQPDHEVLDKVVTKWTKAIIVISPDNPTGRVLTKDSTKYLADLAEDRGSWIMFDETYRDIIYGKTKHHFMAHSAPNSTVGCFSFSKCASVPGLRLGYVYGPQNVINAIEKLQQYMILCPDTYMQKVMVKFFEGNIAGNYIKKTVLPTYTERRDMMAKALKKYLPKAKFTIPEGAFYYFPDMSAYMGKMNEDQFCTSLLERAQVAVVPGNYFGDAGKRHIRMTFVSEPMERIEEGVARMAKFVGETQ